MSVFGIYQGKAGFRKCNFRIFISLYRVSERPGAEPSAVSFVSSVKISVKRKKFKSAAGCNIFGISRVRGSKQRNLGFKSHGAIDFCHAPVFRNQNEKIIGILLCVVGQFREEKFHISAVPIFFFSCNRIYI